MEKEEVQKIIIWLAMVAVFMVTSGVLLVLGY
jgi:hypothetical protein